MKRCQFCKTFSAWNYCAWCGKGKQVRDAVIIIGLLTAILLTLWIFGPYIGLMLMILGVHL